MHCWPDCTNCIIQHSSAMAFELQLSIRFIYRRIVWVEFYLSNHCNLSLLFLARSTICAITARHNFDSFTNSSQQPCNRNVTLSLMVWNTPFTLTHTRRDGTWNGYLNYLGLGSFRFLQVFSIFFQFFGKHKLVTSQQNILFN